MHDIYQNIEQYNPNKNRKILAILMIGLLICLVIKNLNPIVPELLLGGIKHFSCFY